MTQLITLASLNRPLTCAEFDSNNQALRERANHTGTQLSSTISDFAARVDGLPTIVALQLCCSDLTASIATLRDDIFGSGDLNALLSALEARVVNQINALAAVVGSQQDQITTLTLDISSIIANIQALTTSTSSLQAQITSLTSVVATKAPINSPALTGTPTAPTPAPGNNSTNIATTAFVAASVFPATDTSFGTVRTNTFDVTPIVYRKQEVDTLLASYAPLVSPQFSGTARIAPGSEPLASANDNKIPTTAWVRNYLASASSVVPLATSSTRGILKTNTDSLDPIVYLKQESDALLDAKAPINNPTFTGNCVVPNASLTGSSVIATTSIQGIANLTLPPPPNDNSTRIPNTSWVVSYVTGATAAPTPSTGEQPETAVLMGRFTGSYTVQRRASIDALLKTLKTNGIYQLLDRLFIFTSPTEADSKQNWITTYNNPLTGTGFFSPEVGWEGLSGSNPAALIVSTASTLTNAKFNNLTVLTDVWSRTNSTSVIRSSTANSSANYVPVSLTASIATSGSAPYSVNRQGDMTLSYDSPSFEYSSNNKATYSATGSNISVGSFMVSASVRGPSSQLYFGGTQVNNGTRNIERFNAGIGDDPVDLAGDLVITTTANGFCTCAAIGGYLSPSQHQILSNAIQYYVSSYIRENWFGEAI